MPPAAAPATPGVTPATGPAPAAPGPRARSKPRKLVPGVFTTIPVDAGEGETFQGPQEFVEITKGQPELEWTPQLSSKSETLYEMAKATIFRRMSPSPIGTRANVWNLEISFKPMRIISVDVPQPQTQNFQRKNIRYIVYKIRNPGYHINPVAKVDEQGNTIYPVERVNHSVRFFPTFVLESRNTNPPKGYLDRVVPIAQRAIQAREQPPMPLRNSVEIGQIDIPVSTPEKDNSVWGVAMWEDIDGKLDYFSVYVQGLSNAYKFEDPAGALKPGDPPLTGRRYAYKTLQLNFWRPGDEYLEHEEEIRFGTPDDIDYRWVYR